MQDIYPTPARVTVAVVGLGGIGGVAAGCLREAGRHAVVACARRAFDCLTLERPERTVNPMAPVSASISSVRPARVSKYIVAAGERHAIATPLNRALLTLLRAVSDAAPQAGQRIRA
jgi:ketopantoate reductase